MKVLERLCALKLFVNSVLGRITDTRSVRRLVSAFNKPPCSSSPKVTLPDILMSSPAAQDESGHPTIHTDPLSGRHVYIAPRRAERPSDLDGEVGAPCPFCLGNEALTPATVRRWPEQPDVPWTARIVTNRYPVVESLASMAKADTAPTTCQPRLITPAHGLHEIVIEAAAHVESVLDVHETDWLGVWQLCCKRLADVADRTDLAWSTVFKNGGLAAGASLAHLHSQLIAIDRVPPTIQQKCRQMADQPDLFKRILADAEADDRIICREQGLVALVPPAPRQPYEVLLLPENPSPFLHAAQTAQIDALAHLTHSFVAALQQLTPGTSFNWWLHQFPLRPQADASALTDHWHWHLEILPRLNPLAGFELGTDYHITTVSPVQAARRLRATGCWHR